eukprot:5959136-Prymnesium_polylepis.2
MVVQIDPAQQRHSDGNGSHFSSHTHTRGGRLRGQTPMRRMIRALPASTWECVPERATLRHAGAVRGPREAPKESTPLRTRTRIADVRPSRGRRVSLGTLPGAAPVPSGMEHVYGMVVLEGCLAPSPASARGPVPTAQRWAAPLKRGRTRVAAVRTTHARSTGYPSTRLRGASSRPHTADRYGGTHESCVAPNVRRC